MSALSPQKALIVEKLRSMKWVCGSAWLNQIKDDRIRITELNRTYMKSKGFEIKGEPCKGKACGRKDCPLYMRKATKIEHECEGCVASREAVKAWV